LKERRGEERDPLHDSPVGVFSSFYRGQHELFLLGVIHSGSVFSHWR